MPGRSIRIFLVDGTSSGLRTAELALSTLKAVVVPRASLSTVTKRTELHKTGVYVLVGTDTEKLGQKKYALVKTTQFLRDSPPIIKMSIKTSGRKRSYSYQRTTI